MTMEFEQVGGIHPLFLLYLLVCAGVYAIFGLSVLVVFVILSLMGIILFVENIDKKRPKKLNNPEYFKDDPESCEVGD